MNNQKDSIGDCKICHVKILATTDYVKVEDYIKGLKNGEGFYHRECFRERMTGAKNLLRLQGMAEDMMGRANRFMEHNN